MWLIDLSAGVSEAGLFLSLLHLEEETIITLINKMQTALKSNDVLLLFLNNPGNSIEEKLLFLKNDLEEKPPVQIEDWIKDSDQYFLHLKSIAESRVEPLTAFELFLYICLIILLEQYSGNKQILFTAPTAAIRSSTGALNRLKGRSVHLKESAHPLSEGIAYLLAGFSTFFVEDLPVVMGEIKEFTDPFDPSVKVRIFEYREIIADEESDIIAVLETNIDDTTPEVLSGTMNRILNQGALDYTIIPVSMKKSRMGFMVQVLCHLTDSQKMTTLLLEGTSTFGVRKSVVTRTRLKRVIEEIETDYGRIRVKKGYLKNKIIRITPEFDDIIKVSESTGESIEYIYRRISIEIEKNC